MLPPGSLHECVCSRAVQTRGATRSQQRKAQQVPVHFLLLGGSPATGHLIVALIAQRDQANAQG